MALSTTSMTLDGRDIASLVGRGFKFLQALEIKIKLHHSIKLLKLLAVNHDKDESVIVVCRLDMYRTKVLMYSTMVLMARPTKVRR